MANYNIEINYLNSSGEYDVLGPSFSGFQTYSSSYVGTGTWGNNNPTVINLSTLIGSYKTGIGVLAGYDGINHLFFAMPNNSSGTNYKYVFVSNNSYKYREYRIEFNVGEAKIIFIGFYKIDGTEYKIAEINYPYAQFNALYTYKFLFLYHV